MPITQGQSEVDVESIAEHNRQALRGINTVMYGTVALLVAAALGFVVAFAALIVAVVR
jgi:hypothetical protein